MNLQIIKNEKEYEDRLEWVDTQFDLNIAPESKEGGESLQIAILLIKQYEDLHYVIPYPDAIIM
jgi:HTH-type transcriptional regulator/antitoxin HigA